MVVVGMGKMGRRASWRQMAWSTAEISRSSLKMLVVIIILGFILKNDKDELHNIKRRYKNLRKEKGDSLVMPGEFDNAESLNVQEVTKLYEVEKLTEDVEGICNEFEEDDCHSDSRCSWCKAGAVSDSCHSIENAKNLPASIFACDNLDFVKEEKS
jgi:hypothetical protein